jgi:hypothetical protein
MADDDDDDDNNNARGVASAASPRPSRWGRTNSTPPPDCCPFAPTSTVVLSFPRGPPGRIVPASCEVERRSPPREGVGAVVRGRPLPPLALLHLARRRPCPPSASPIFSCNARASPPATGATSSRPSSSASALRLSHLFIRRCHRLLPSHHRLAASLALSHVCGDDDDQGS